MCKCRKRTTRRSGAFALSLFFSGEISGLWQGGNGFSFARQFSIECRLIHIDINVGIATRRSSKSFEKCSSYHTGCYGSCNVLRITLGTRQFTHPAPIRHDTFCSMATPPYRAQPDQDWIVAAHPDPHLKPHQAHANRTRSLHMSG
jgi:hypothetical protein